MILKTLITYLNSFFWVAVFLIVTSGFTVYTHNCNATSVTKHSLFESLATCNHIADIQNIHSCCNTNNHIATNCNKCCSDKKQFHKISDVFNITPPYYKEIQKHNYVLISSFVIQKLELKKIIKEHVTLYSLPPPLTGKQIVIYNHQLKTYHNHFVV